LKWNITSNILLGGWQHILPLKLHFFFCQTRELVFVSFNRIGSPDYLRKVPTTIKGIENVTIFYCRMEDQEFSKVVATIFVYWKPQNKPNQLSILQSLLSSLRKHGVSPIPFANSPLSFLSATCPLLTSPLPHRSRCFQPLWSLRWCVFWTLLFFNSIRYIYYANQCCFRKLMVRWRCRFWNSSISCSGFDFLGGLISLFFSLSLFLCASG